MEMNLGWRPNADFAELGSAQGIQLVISDVAAALAEQTKALQSMVNEGAGPDVQA